MARFGDLVSRVNTKEDRFNTDKNFYVGGEHIESNELLVHAKGMIEGSTIGPMFYFGFKAGDILFVTRNPHLRKAAMVEFDGICSEKTLVLATNDESILLQSYLAIVMQSDDFWEYCEDNKSGGVNYFINWSTLEEYEFDLPPIDEQKKIASQIWAAYRLKEAYKSLLTATEEMVKSQFIEMFGNPVSNDRNWECEPIRSIAPESPATHISDNQVWLLNLDMIESGTGNIVEKVFIPKENVISAQPFDEGNVLFSKLRPYLNKVVCPNGKGYATTELVPLRPKQDKLNKTFFTYLLRSDQFVQFANDISGGTKMPRMPLKELREFKCILPPIKLQEGFAMIVRQADKSKFELKKAIEAIDQVIKSLING